jgi:ABC-type uncharacterized transport system ATPase subunit
LLQTSAPEWEILESESSGNTSVATIKHPQHSTEGHALLKLLIHEQLDILTFEKRNPSLEEIFLTATQRSWNLSTPTTLSRKSPTPQEVNQ